MKKKNYLDVFMDAYWKNNLDLSDEKILIQLLACCKIDPEKFFNGIKDQSIKDNLKKLTEEAFQKEVFGAPTFIVNNKLFWGQDRFEYALEELKIN
jgi:2-hydroxychromene-2-carboxylate isomerase